MKTELIEDKENQAVLNLPVSHSGSCGWQYTIVHKQKRRVKKNSRQMTGEIRGIGWVIGDPGENNCHTTSNIYPPGKIPIESSTAVK
ncbi:hypothetical protein [Salinimonas marina]|uniref:hypothetical protein n=1 Tax=Salinimonas marina TaxID=2785918 RepID=UPI001C5538E0|nr:hypothetical protein [Salinimonas marina]